MKKIFWIIAIVYVIGIGVLGYVYRNQLKTIFTKQMGLNKITPLPGIKPGSLTLTSTTAQKGSFLTGPNGKSLYIFDNDRPGKSNCVDTCTNRWPPYIATENSVSGEPHVTTITRSDGAIQYAYDGLPLYFYSADKKPGDVLGDAVDGVWHLAKP